MTPLEHPLRVHVGHLNLDALYDIWPDPDEDDCTARLREAVDDRGRAWTRGGLAAVYGMEAVRRIERAAERDWLEERMDLWRDALAATRGEEVYDMRESA